MDPQFFKVARKAKAAAFPHSPQQKNMKFSTLLSWKLYKKSQLCIHVSDGKQQLDRK